MRDAATKTITAYVPLIASRSVRHDPVLLCVADRFADKPLTVKRYVTAA